MTSRTRQEKFKASYRCPECNKITHLKNKKYVCPEHGIVKPNYVYEKPHISIHKDEFTKHEKIMKSKRKKING